MTSTAVRASLSTQIPQTQNTAPVKEFRCLYTRDLRRKAKRWQDGILRYHTFNRRVMVYDTLRSFIGDTFNPGGAELQEGDELDLEKDFIMVEVGEPMGTTQTDLTELLEKRHKHKETSVNNTPARTRVSQESTNGPCQKHRSLTALLGTPKGPLGKAVLPKLSPFEERQKRKAHIDHGSSKRQKQSTAPSILARPPPHAASSPGSSPIRRATAPQSKPHQIHQSSKPPVVIDLSSDTIGKDDSFPPSSPPVRSNTLDGTGPQSLSDPAAPPVVSKSAAISPRERCPDGFEDEAPKRMPLKVISNAPRKMLLCQQKPAKRPENKANDRTPKDTAPARLESDSATVTKPPAEPVLAPHQQRLKERLAKIGQKKHAKPILGSQPDEDTDVTAQPRPFVQSVDAASVVPVAASSIPIVTEAIPNPRNARSDNAAVEKLASPTPVAVTSRAVSSKETHQPGDPTIVGRGTSEPLVQKGCAREVSSAQLSDAQIKNAQHNKSARISDRTARTIDPKPSIPAKELPKVAAAQPQTAGRSLSRSESDPLAKPFKPPGRPATRAVSKSIPTNKPAEPAQAGNPLDSGPWSREAMDLFDWWPPDRDKQGNKTTAATTKA